LSTILQEILHLVWLQARQQEAAALCAQYSVTPADLDVVDLQKVLKKSWSIF